MSRYTLIIVCLYVLFPYFKLPEGFNKIYICMIYVIYIVIYIQNHALIHLADVCGDSLKK